MKVFVGYLVLLFLNITIVTCQYQESVSTVDGYPRQPKLKEENPIDPKVNQQSHSSYGNGQAAYFYPGIPLAYN